MKHNRSQPTPLKRWALILAGSLCVGLGTLGILLPLLPTTPFLLLAAACYVRSSQRFYNWLLTNRWLGEYIRNYRDGHGIPRSTKLVVIALLWLTIGFSALVVVPVLIGKLALLLIAIGVTTHVLTIKTLDRRPAASAPRDAVQTGRQAEEQQ
jgi:uncharacterized protein